MADKQPGTAAALSELLDQLASAELPNEAPQNLARDLTAGIAELQESAGQFRALVELAADSYWQLDEKLNLVQFVSHVGERPEYFLSTLRDLLRSRKRASREIDQPFKDFEICRSDESDEVIWTSVSGTPIFDNHGSFCGYQGVSRDITARKQDEEQLRLQSERFLIAQAAARIMVADLDLAKKTLEYSDDPVWLRGPLPANLKNYPPLLEQVHAEDKAEFIAQREHAIRGVRGGKPEFRVVRTDGQMVWVQAHQTVFTDADGKTTRLVSAIEDITERKQYERMLEDARDEANSANRAKSEFLANMSHEIRTPMNAIIGLTHLALRREIEPQQRDYLTKIDTAANSLLRIINSILDLSKIEAGKTEIEEVEFDLYELLTDVAGVTGVRAIEKNLKFQVDAEPTLPVNFVGDPGHLAQVLINLCGNAVKFTEQGEIVLGVRHTVRAEGCVVLEFSIADTGIGLAPEEQLKLFKPFSQADNSTTRKYGGTGLGLSIARQLVELMGGTIRVVSQLARGSTFIFSVIGQAGRPPPILPDARSQPLHGKRVLLIDDDYSFRLAMARDFENWRVRVSFTANPRQGLELLAKAEEPFEFVLIDRELAGSDGLKLAALIRSETRIAVQPKILLITAYRTLQPDAPGESDPIDAILHKPFTPMSLFDTLANFVRPATARRAIADAHNLNGARVLLVEDDEVNQEVALAILESMGARVRVANHGQEALAMIAAGKVNGDGFDVVLMDLHMPVMDGIETTQRMRSDSALSDLPIIAMTASAMTGDRERFLAAGMSDYIGKPIQLSSLYSTLAKWLNKPYTERRARQLSRYQQPVG